MELQLGLLCVHRLTCWQKLQQHTERNCEPCWTFQPWGFACALCGQLLVQTTNQNKSNAGYYWGSISSDSTCESVEAADVVLVVGAVSA